MQKTPGNTPAKRERYWTKVIEEARRYPKGITEYCRVMNLSKNNYYFWFKRLRPQHPDWHDLTSHPEIIAPNRQSKKIQAKQNDSVPDTEVSTVPRRRKWSAADKKRILEETDKLTGPDLAASLRREGVYVHTLNKWRTERDLVRIAASKSKSSGPNPLSVENRKLREENARLQKKLQHASEIIQLQKKISQLTMALDASEE